jgi:hypothetical protein
MEMDTGNHGHQYEHGYGKRFLDAYTWTYINTISRCIWMDAYTWMYVNGCICVDTCVKF